jgi:hypothetical protein
MQKYIPIAAGVVILILIVVGFIMIQTNQSKLTTNQPVQTQTNETANNTTGEVAPPQTTPVPTIGEISLTISSPTNGTIVKKSTLTVSGTTVPRAEVAVNETEVVADTKGNFSANITLDEGDNLIVITANDASGNLAETELTVTYDTGQ